MAFDVVCAEGRRVWTPSLALGKPFPTRQVPVEVWGIGAFKFKGIAGTSKVCLLITGRLAAADSKLGCQHALFYTSYRACPSCLNNIHAALSAHSEVIVLEPVSGLLEALEILLIGICTSASLTDTRLRTYHSRQAKATSNCT